MEKIVLVYDNTIKVNERIKTIIGNKSFGEMVLKRKKLYQRVEEAIKNLKQGIKFIKIDKKEQFKEIEVYSKDTIFFHLLSNAAIINMKEFEIILEKLKYVNETTIIECNGIKGAIFSNKDAYIEFLEEYANTNNLNNIQGNRLQTDIFTDLTDYSNLIMYISSGFDARYFNSIQGNNYTVTKKSADKKKMKMEYTYYWLLPESMKSWMVMPYDYKEEKDYASYTMERMPMTDVAIRWTHGAIDINEFKCLMDKVFYFFSIRKKSKIEKEEYNKCAKKLYLEKVDERIERLKKLDEFETICKLIQSGTDYNSIDEIVDLYKRLYEKSMKRVYKSNNYESVIGHGDVFFANMLYSKEVNLLRLIDPKGALEEKDLWTNPYYDIAKLSHSVCGNYDFFNVGAYDIELNKKMKFDLHIHFDNTRYKEIFKQYLKEFGYDYILVRLYEASLFLSMLPLHIDNPHKVFGFLLNAINILKEIEKDV